MDTKLKQLKEKIENNKKILNELRPEIESLEQKRVERLAEVTRNNSDEIAQQTLKTIEKGLDLKKNKRRVLEKQIAEITQQYNEFQRQQNFKLSDNIQEELAKSREERDWLRSEMIPSLQRQLQELEDRKKELDARVLSLSNQLSKIHRQTSSEDNETQIQDDKI